MHTGQPSLDNTALNLFPKARHGKFHAFNDFNLSKQDAGKKEKRKRKEASR